MAKQFRIKKEFRSRLSEKLMDLGNYTLVGLTLGQLISDELNLTLFVGGIVFTTICYFGAYGLE